MNKEEILQMLTASADPKTTVQWLREEYFPEIQSRFNSEESKKRFGLYQNEQIPVNERNLTDVRTRMGVLIEFELARISNEILPEFGVRDIFWSYVVANRFPDLEVRKNSGDRLLRLEIKCLQCIAEEKSANFDTLIKDVDPNTDFVVVCLWDWSKEPGSCCEWDMAPQIYKIYVFHAYSLVQLRDTYWLNNPPANLGGGYQGFDIRYAVTCADGLFSKEQGNYGKLTRIWKHDFMYRPIESDVIQDTEREYCEFQNEIIQTGFELIATAQLFELTGERIDAIEFEEKNVGFKSNNIAYVSSNIISSNKKLLQLIEQYNLKIVVTMTEKYKSSIYIVNNDDIKKIATNQKPKNVLGFINHFES